MVAKAQHKGLLDPPPYSDERKKSAWQSGYLAALHDISRDYLRHDS